MNKVINLVFNQVIFALIIILVENEWKNHTMLT